MCIHQNSTKFKYNKMIYIHLQEGFIEVQQAFESSLTGVTLDEYYSGKYVPLNENQIAFLKNNPGIAPPEAYLMVTSPSIEEIFIHRKKERMFQIFRYDQSEAVNVFFVNSSPMWLSRSARASLFTTLAAYKANNRTSITLWSLGVNPYPITLSVESFENLLLSLEMYAKECYDRTAEHKANVSRIETIEELMDYNHTQGYPQPLVFTI